MVVQFSGYSSPLTDFKMTSQASGQALKAEEIYQETWCWLQERGCRELIAPRLVEQYAMSFSRWIQCEELLSKVGFLGAHPTTGAEIASPYVAIAKDYQKQANSIWAQIYQVVRENCSGEYETTAQDGMEWLLRTGKRK